MKKLLSLALVLTMLLAGTSAMAFNETGYPISDEMVIVTAAFATGGKTDMSGYALLEELEMRLGIRVDATAYSTEAWKTQFTLMLASDNLPDMVLNSGLSLSEVADLGAQGYFMPLNDLIDQYAPNLKAKMEEYPRYTLYSTAPDGNMYTIVGLQDVAQPANRQWINRTWLENLDLEYPTSVEALRDVLIAFRDQDANGNGDATDEIPMSNFANHLPKSMKASFGLRSNNEHYLLDEKDGQVFLGETSENYKAYLTYMHDLWNDNLLDHDNFIQTDDEFRSKASEERVGVFFDWAPFVAAGKALDYDQGFYWLGALTSDYLPERTVITSDFVSTIPYFLLNAETEFAKEIVRLMDYFFSDEGKLAGKYGYEGMNYDMINLEIDGLESYGVVKVRQPEGYSSTEDYRNNAVTPGDFWSPYTPAMGTYHAAAMIATPEQLEALLPLYGWGVLVQRDCMHKTDIKKIEAFPALLYTEEETAERTSLYMDVSLYIESMHAQFIIGQVDIDTGWDDFLATLDTIRLPRLLEIEQAAYDRLMGR